MPDPVLVTITELPNAATLDGTERVPMDQGGVTKDASVQQIANLAPGTDLGYTQSTRLLSSSTGADVTLPLATDALDGLMSAAQRLLTQALIGAGVQVSGTAVVLPHIHGDLAGSVYIHVKNTSGGQLTKGTPVRVTGAVGDTTTLEVAAADSASAGTMPAIGILADTLANNASGHATVAGELTGLNTAGFSIGQALYVAAGGGMTGTMPGAGTVQQVAIVGRSHASTGSVTVTISGTGGGGGGGVSLTNTAPLSVGTGNSVGTSGEAARADHIHRSLGGVIVIPLTSESENLTVATLITVPWWPQSTTLEGTPIWMLNVAPTGSSAQFDIRINGTSIFSTLPTILAGNITSGPVSGAFSPTFVAALLNIPQASSVTIHCTQRGSSVLGAGLKVALPSRRTN